MVTSYKKKCRPVTKIYVDASYPSSHQAEFLAGFAAVLVNSKGKVKFVALGAGRYKQKTEAEVAAIQLALDQIHPDTPTTIYSDNQSVILALKTLMKVDPSCREVNTKTQKLCLSLMPSIEFRKVYFSWCRGHHNNRYNRLADTAAKKARANWMVDRPS